jgi:hypothetical protein
LFSLFPLGLELWQRRPGALHKILQIRQTARDIFEGQLGVVFEASFEQLPHQLIGADLALFGGGLQLFPQLFGYAQIYLTRLTAAHDAEFLPRDD